MVLGDVRLQEAQQGSRGGQRREDGRAQQPTVVHLAQLQEEPGDPEVKKC